MTFQHYSVLLNETIEQLDIKENGIYVDGTLGGGGHASAVLQRLGETGRLIGIDSSNRSSWRTPGTIWRQSDHCPQQL